MYFTSRFRSPRSPKQSRVSSPLRPLLRMRTVELLLACLMLKGHRGPFSHQYTEGLLLLYPFAPSKNHRKIIQQISELCIAFALPGLFYLCGKMEYVSNITFQLCPNIEFNVVARKK